MRQVGVGQSRIGQGKSRILLNGLLEIAGALFDFRDRPLVHAKTAFEVKLIRFWIWSVLVDGPTPVRRCELHLNLLRDRSAQLILQGQVPARFAVIIVRPQMNLILDLDQLGADPGYSPFS